MGLLLNHLMGFKIMLIATDLKIGYVFKIIGLYKKRIGGRHH